MKPEDRKRLFSEYTRFNAEANRATEGTGLGLCITGRLVEMMGGTIKVESEYGKGSVFTVTVKQKAVPCPPIGAETAEHLRNFTFTVSRADAAKEQIIREPMPYGRVLVVDDVDTNLYVAEGLLAPYRLKIETVNSGSAAIELVKNGNVYDVIFMDHMMPLMDGVEATQKIRELGYTGVVVALTANALVGSEQIFLQNGFDGFVSKPIDIRHLNSTLNKFIRDRHPDEHGKYELETAKRADATKTNPKLLKVFLRDAKSVAAILRESIAASDMKLFAIKVHAMKSALANVGENALSLKAAALEKAVGDGDTDYINRNAGSFFDALEALIKKLTPNDTGTMADDEINEDGEFLREQLQIIAAACENYDNRTAYAALDKLEAARLKSKTVEAIEKIRDALFLASDFEEAGELANELGTASKD
jgi:CheY-like chemotaxis protein